MKIFSVRNHLDVQPWVDVGVTWRAVLFEWSAAHIGLSWMSDEAGPSLDVTVTLAVTRDGLVAAPHVLQVHVVDDIVCMYVLAANDGSRDAWKCIVEGGGGKFVMVVDLLYLRAFAFPIKELQ
jgi:hypothetical protein